MKNGRDNIQRSIELVYKRQMNAQKSLNLIPQVKKIFKNYEDMRNVTALTNC